MDKAALRDRDGVINRKASEGEYITNWEAAALRIAMGWIRPDRESSGERDI
jgi:hypothetical protein